MLEKAKVLGQEDFQSKRIFRKGCNNMIVQKKIDFDQINHSIQPYILSLLRRLLPNGKIEGHEYVALNPTRCDKRRGSFRINTHTGRWGDFATRDKGGDIISLWAYVRGISQIDAARELQSIVGGA